MIMMCVRRQIVVRMEDVLVHQQVLEDLVNVELIMIVQHRTKCVVYLNATMVCVAIRQDRRRLCVVQQPAFATLMNVVTAHHCLVRQIDLRHLAHYVVLPLATVMLPKRVPVAMPSVLSTMFLHSASCVVPRPATVISLKRVMDETKHVQTTCFDRRQPCVVPQPACVTVPNDVQVHQPRVRAMYSHRRRPYVGRVSVNATLLNDVRVNRGCVRSTRTPRRRRCVVRHSRCATLLRNAAATRLNVQPTECVWR
mmetsp:Transcript_6291/g.10828  ORF Transcript_6291/g.10828 Transcript_6291/m.10828 type:complete len:253 (+) Transcript_6291:1001-1759(+)